MHGRSPERCRLRRRVRGFIILRFLSSSRPANVVGTRGQLYNSNALIRGTGLKRRPQHHVVPRHLSEQQRWRHDDRNVCNVTGSCAEPHRRKDLHLLGCSPDRSRVRCRVRCIVGVHCVQHPRRYHSAHADPWQPAGSPVLGSAHYLNIEPCRGLPCVSQRCPWLSDLWLWLHQLHRHGIDQRNELQLPSLGLLLDCRRCLVISSRVNSTDSGFSTDQRRNDSGQDNSSCHIHSVSEQWRSDNHVISCNLYQQQRRHNKHRHGNSVACQRHRPLSIQELHLHGRSPERCRLVRRVVRLDSVRPAVGTVRSDQSCCGSRQDDRNSELRPVIIQRRSDNHLIPCDLYQQQRRHDQDRDCSLHTGDRDAALGSQGLQLHGRCPELPRLVVRVIRIDGLRALHDI